MHQWEIRKGWDALSVFCLRENDVRWKKATDVRYDTKIDTCILVWNCSRGSICNCSAASLRHECCSRERLRLAAERKCKCKKLRDWSKIIIMSGEVLSLASCYTYSDTLFELHCHG